MVPSAYGPDMNGNHHQAVKRRTIMPKKFGSHRSVLSEHQELDDTPELLQRQRSGSDSSSSSPRSPIDNHLNLMLLPSHLTRSPALTRKAEKSVTVKTLTLPRPTLQKSYTAPRTASCDIINSTREGRSTTTTTSSNRKKKLHRSQSEPLCFKPTESRRSIFDSFWESQRDIGSGVLLPTTTAVNRPRSLQWERVPAVPSPPAWLPSVPTPLVRMHTHGGAYPLLAPKSILRRSYRKDADDTHDNDDDDDEVVLNLTQSMRLTPKSIGSFRLSPQSDEQQDTEDNDTTTDRRSVMNNNNNQSRTPSVHFDPRVVVTELADVEPRVWYTDQELQSFQAETVALARSYLQANPTLIPLYSQPVRNPVTQQHRKRALFSLAIFCCSDIQVDRILVVDPQPMALELLRRHMRALFPMATEIHCCREVPADEEDGSSSTTWDIRLVEASVWDSSAISSSRNNGLLIAISSAPAGCTSLGADVVWSKPPPPVGAELQTSLTEALRRKRKGLTST